MKSLIVSVLLISTSVFAGTKDFVGQYGPKDANYCGWKVMYGGTNTIFLRSTENTIMNTGPCAISVLWEAHCSGTTCEIEATKEKIEFRRNGNIMIFDRRIVNHRLAE